MEELKWNMIKNDDDDNNNNNPRGLEIPGGNRNGIFSPLAVRLKTRNPKNQKSKHIPYRSLRR